MGNTTEFVVAAAAAAVAVLFIYVRRQRSAVRSAEDQTGWAGRNSTKDQLRQRVWQSLADSGDARDEDGPFNRIPDFAGAEAAAEHLRKLPLWKSAKVIKSNPDPPQAFVRRAALQDGKRLYVPVPCLTHGFPFLLLDPSALRAAGLTPDDVMFSGVRCCTASVEFSRWSGWTSASSAGAVTSAGGRTGSGRRPRARLFRHYGTCVPGVTPVVSTVHALQVVASDEIVRRARHAARPRARSTASRPHRVRAAGQARLGQAAADQYENIPFLKTLRQELERK